MEAEVNAFFHHISNSPPKNFFPSQNNAKGFGARAHGSYQKAKIRDANEDFRVRVVGRVRREKTRKLGRNEDFVVYALGQMRQEKLGSKKRNEDFGVRFLVKWVAKVATRRPFLSQLVNRNSDLRRSEFELTEKINTTPSMGIVRLDYGPDKSGPIGLGLTRLIRRIGAGAPLPSP